MAIPGAPAKPLPGTGPAFSLPSEWRIWAGGAVIALAALAAYGNSFSGPFVFDDIPAILNNHSIEHWRSALSPPSSATVSGRPLLNLSLALNYAVSGRNVWSYHALNLVIHGLAGLTLFGIVRRTLRGNENLAVSATVEETARFSSEVPALLAFIVALLWTVHPLQTESVTYIVQRAESLMGLFFLLTFYCFIRSAETDDGTKRWRVPLRSGTRQRFVSGWAIFSVLACLLGMAMKEVMVSVPVLVLLYDRTFVSGSFRAALKGRQGYYAGLAGTWVLLAALAIANGNRGGTSGFNVGVPWWAYAETQFPAVVHYLTLSVWPHPLVFDYGTQWVTSFSEIAPAFLVVIALVAAIVFALVGPPAGPGPGGRRALGFAGAWFFAILAPTSLVPGTRQTMAEHRMYLALAPLLAVGVTVAYRLVVRSLGWVGAGRVALVLGLAAAAGLGWATARRNDVYRTEQALWADTAAKVPDNFYAQNNLGDALLREDQLDQAIACYEKALRTHADFFEAQNNLGVALGRAGRRAEGIPHLEKAVQLKPDFVAGQTNLGAALVALGRVAEAIPHFEQAWRIEPKALEAYNLADALALAGRLPEAISRYGQAVSLEPDFTEAHDHLGVALTRAGRLPEASAQFAAALALKPDQIEARYNLAMILLETGKARESVPEFEAVLRLKPDFAEAQGDLGNALREIGQVAEAIPHLQEAVRLAPSDPQIHYNLGVAYAGAARRAEAIGEYEEALRLKPDFPDALDNLGVSLAKSGRVTEAITRFEKALQFKPDFAQAHRNLGLALQSLGRGDAAKVHFEQADRLEADAQSTRK